MTETNTKVTLTFQKVEKEQNPEDPNMSHRDDVVFVSLSSELAFDGVKKKLPALTLQDRAKNLDAEFADKIMEGMNMVKAQDIDLNLLNEELKRIKKEAEEIVEEKKKEVANTKKEEEKPAAKKEKKKEKPKEPEKKEDVVEEKKEETQAPIEDADEQKSSSDEVENPGVHEPSWI